MASCITGDSLRLMPERRPGVYKYPVVTTHPTRTVEIVIILRIQQILNSRQLAFHCYATQFASRVYLHYYIPPTTP